MKIVHICLDSQYIDGWGYQENLLPEYLSYEGTKNFVIASSTTFPPYMKDEDKVKIIAKGGKYLFNGVHIIRIPTKSITSSFFIYKGLTKELCRIQPDLIFEHGVSPFTLSIVCRYARKHKCIVDVDNHADEINLGNKKVWNILYYRIACNFICYMNLQIVNKFYGVTLGRCDFLKKYCHIPESQLEFLPIGADVKTADSLPEKNILREKYGFGLTDVIVVSGGKMGVEKCTDNLIKSVQSISLSNPEVHLLLFGKFEDEETKTLAENSSTVRIEGWCNRIKTLELLKLADVACWPYHHTTLVEDAISVNTPLILRRTRTTEHLITNNGWWIDNASIKDLSKSLLIAKKSFRDRRIINGCEEKKKEISYYTIAKKVINEGLL